LGLTVEVSWTDPVDGRSQVSPSATASPLRLSDPEASGRKEERRRNHWIRQPGAHDALRLLEQWRDHLGVDHDGALIVLATLAITMENMRAYLSLRSEFLDVRNTEIPLESLTKCSVSSIAAATGLNRGPRVGGPLSVAAGYSTPTQRDRSG